jgi:hypothetical protein
MARSRRVGEFLVLALLMLTGAAGLKNGPDELRGARGFLQNVVSIAVMLYGVAGLIAAYALWRRQRWTLPVMMLWGVGGVTAATVAPVAYSSSPAPPLWSVALGGFAAAALAVAAIAYSYGPYVEWSREPCRRTTRTIRS